MGFSSAMLRENRHCGEPDLLGEFAQQNDNALVSAMAH
jgi:hypothetical protein